MQVWNHSIGTKRACMSAGIKRMLLNNQRNIVVAIVILLVAAVGAAAWIHNSQSRPIAAPAAITDNGLAPAPAQQPYATDYTPAPAPTLSSDGYYPLVSRPAYVREGEAPYPAVAPPPQADAQYFDGQDANGTYTEVRRPGPRTYREYHHGRSKKHSVEIVAGTAAAGAAIGAIAGGGKGAALGGLSGAGAGFVYDRLTHNR